MTAWASRARDRRLRTDAWWVKLTACPCVCSAAPAAQPESGNETYLQFYPEHSSDGILRLGNVAPDFAAETTMGNWDSYHEWLGDSWGVLFSHPADFTPVCTTEIGRLALAHDWLSEHNVKVATLSVDGVDSHNAWLEDVVAHCENDITIDFPIIGE